MRHVSQMLAILATLLVYFPAFARANNCVAVSVEEEQTWAKIDLVWSGQTRPDKGVTLINIQGSRNLTVRLNGANTSVAVGSMPKPVPLVLLVDTIIERPSQKKTQVGFALMSAQYDQQKMDVETKNKIEAEIDGVAKRLGKHIAILTKAQEEELKKLGIVRIDITSTVLKQSPSFTAQGPVFVEVLERPAKPPKDLYQYGNRLKNVQKQYRTHVGAVKSAKEAFRRNAEISEKMTAPLVDILFASQIAALELQTVKNAFEAIPDNTKRITKISRELLRLQNELVELYELDDIEEIFVYVPMKKTSATPRAVYTEARSALVDEQVSYAGTLSRLLDAYKRNEGDFSSVNDIKNSPELKKIQSNIKWIKSVLPKNQPDNARKKIQALTIVRVKINEYEKESAALVKAEKDTKSNASELAKLTHIEVEALEKLTGKPAPDILEQGSIRNTLVLVGYALKYADLHEVETRQSLADLKKLLNKSYADWTGKDQSLAVHTAHLLETRKAAASAICNSYKNMSDNESYRDLMAQTNRYITVMSYAPTLMMAPTPANIELATSGALDAGYRRSLANIGRKVAVDALTFRTKTADDLRLIGMKARSHELSVLRNRKFSKDYFKTLPEIPGRSKIDIFKDNLRLFEKTATTISTTKTIFETAILYEKNDPTAAFKGMKAIMGIASTADWALAGSGFAMPIHASLLSFHLAILADAAKASIEAGNRIADKKIDEALKASHVKTARQKLYSLRELSGNQFYKTYVGSDDIMQRIATRYQSIYILHELGKNPMIN